MPCEGVRPCLLSLVDDDETFAAIGFFVLPNVSLSAIEVALLTSSIDFYRFLVSDLAISVSSSAIVPDP